MFVMLTGVSMSTRSERERQKAQNDLHTRILNDMLAQPDNKYCAECGTKGQANMPTSI
jgi:hypothetical protein